MLVTTATVSAASVRFACSRRRALRAAAFAASTRIAARIISARSSSRKNQGLYARADVTVNVPFASARASFMPSASFPANEAVASAGITTCTYGDENTGVSTRCSRFSNNASRRTPRARDAANASYAASDASSVSDTRRANRRATVRQLGGARVGSEPAAFASASRIPASRAFPLGREPRREVFRVDDAKRRVARGGVADVPRE